VRIVETSDPIVKLVSPDKRDWHVKLNKEETAILQKAYAICEKAGELQTEVIKRYGDEDDGSENDYSWASIYLYYVLDY